MTLSVKDIFGIADRYCDSAALHFAHQQGVFELLSAAKTSDEVAATLRWQTRKTAILLHALVALGLLERDGQRFTNAAATARALVRSSPDYIGDLVEHERLQWGLWAQLGDILATDEAVAGQQDLNLRADPVANAVFHRAMEQLSNDLVERVIQVEYWSDCSRILDLAGGHGRYLAAVLQAVPDASGEVWDAASAAPYAHRTFDRYDVAHRARFREADISSPSSFERQTADGVMLNHCLHHFDMAGVRRVLSNAVSVLPPGGVITILDVHLDEGRSSPRENALFSLYMMVNVARGEVHPTSEVAGYLTSIGVDVKVEPLQNLEDDFLLVGRRRKCR